MSDGGNDETEMDRGITGMATFMSQYPLALIKVLLQISPPAPGGGTGSLVSAYRTLDLIKSVYASAGVLGFLRGFPVSLGYVFVYINTNQSVRSLLYASTTPEWILTHSRLSFLLRDASFTLLSASIAATLARPFQVVRNHMIASLLPPVPLPATAHSLPLLHNSLTALLGSSPLTAQSTRLVAGSGSLLAALPPVLPGSVMATPWPTLSAWQTGKSIVASSGFSGLFAGLGVSLAGIFVQELVYVAAIQGLSGLWSLMAPYVRGREWDSLSGLEKDGVVAGERSVISSMVHFLGLVAMYPFEVLSRRASLARSAFGMCHAPHLSVYRGGMLDFPVESSLFTGFVFSQICGWY